MANLTEIKDDNFEQEVIKSEIPVVVDFWATWCGPCRKLAPLLEELSENYKEKAKFVKINVEENIETAKKYSIAGLPSLLIFKNGEPIERMTGMLQKSSISSNLEKYL